jgi:4,4'-diaponeurosporenoate glycosyltransferase
VLDNPDLPSHWLCKSWACWNGAQAAKGKILLFADGDTWFEKDGLAKAIDTFSSNKENGFWTIHPFHKMISFYEKLSWFFTLSSILQPVLQPYLPPKHPSLQGDSANA